MTTQRKLTISGGKGTATPLRADYAEMLQAAEMLTQLGSEAFAIAGQIGAKATDARLTVTAPLAPASFAQADAQIVASSALPHGAASLGLQLQAQALTLRASVDVYKAWDDASRVVNKMSSVPKAVAALVEEGLRENSALTVLIIFGGPLVVAGVAGAPSLRSPVLMWVNNHVRESNRPVSAKIWRDYDSTKNRPRSIKDEVDENVVSDRRPGGSPALNGVDPAKSSTLRIRKVRGVDGKTRLVVTLPGTDFDSLNDVLNGGRDPSGTMSDLQLMLGISAPELEEIKRVLLNEKAALGNEYGGMMLKGHSQGGILAAALASDEKFVHDAGVQNVLTYGAPIADFKISDEVQVLSIEHTNDPVPHLDSGDNPKMPNWTTITTEVPAEDLRNGSYAAAHEVERYSETASLIDDSAPELSDYNKSLKQFEACADGDEAVQTKDYLLSR